MSGPQASDVSVLIAAADTDARPGPDPAVLPLEGRPVVDWVAEKARQLGAQVLVACAPGMQAPAGTVAVPGGATRHQTVQRLAERADRPWSLLWDADSPLASLALARRVLAAALHTGAATPCLPGDAPWYVLEQGRIVRTHPGAFAAASQTPLACATLLLQAAGAQARREGWEAQDAVQLLLRTGHAVATVPGEKLNIALATPDDWLLAAALRERLSR